MGLDSFEAGAPDVCTLFMKKDRIWDTDLSRKGRRRKRRSHVGCMILVRHALLEGDAALRKWHHPNGEGAPSAGLGHRTNHRHRSSGSVHIQGKLMSLNGRNIRISPMRYGA
ncbi:hypothetical protein F1559_005191 [Cyanidiococcus yangmingshanensis]|uniref:Uncharacterized protein n=1 Tax=Cyanidiococcus yangmingshanensis TaxID=2690220 RepID=A0A7J7IIT1_9RHOD|nr:hypothetical protein F1559_005191 [Cyanidiococcus yangmingshanensis]